MSVLSAILCHYIHVCEVVELEGRRSMRLELLLSLDVEHHVILMMSGFGKESAVFPSKW